MAILMKFSVTLVTSTEINFVYIKLFLADFNFIKKQQKHSTKPWMRTYISSTYLIIKLVFQFYIFAAGTGVKNGVFGNDFWCTLSSKGQFVLLKFGWEIVFLWHLELANGGVFRHWRHSGGSSEIEFGKFCYFWIYWIIVKSINWYF